MRHVTGRPSLENEALHHFTWEGIGSDGLNSIGVYI
jgi:hypothetical protein